MARILTRRLQSVLMDVILWAPLLILICVTVWDSRQLIRYEFKYLALYFWLVNMIPFLSASFFNCASFHSYVACSFLTRPIYQSLSRRSAPPAASS